MRVLYLHPGPTPPSTNPRRNQFHALSQQGLNGVVLSSIWDVPGENMDQYIEQVDAACGNFSYQPIREANFSRLPRMVQMLWYFVTVGRRLHRQGEPFDVIVSYSTFTPGVAAYLLRWLIGARFVVEIPGVPTATAAILGRTGLAGRAKHCLALWVTAFLLKRAEGTKLLYETQLGNLPRPRLSTAFHDYVPVTDLQPAQRRRKAILFLGHPFYLKGVDVLIKAFHEIAERIPEYSLNIVGYCPDRTQFEALAAGHPRIHLLDPVYPDEAKQMIAESSLLVLPSRTEAMGRVLLEAMATRTPIVASRIDGIPAVVEDGETGLLFESENVNDLAAKILQIIGDADLNERLAENAYMRVHAQLNETHYAARFSQFLHQVCGRCTDTPPDRNAAREASARLCISTLEVQQRPSELSHSQVK